MRGTVSADRYTRTAMLLHWLMAALVIAMFGLGWFMVDLPQGPQRGYYFALHKSLGLCAFTLLCVRVWWRVRHAPPALPAELARWRVTLARSVHLAFYALLVIQPASGYLSSSFSGYATRWFGLPLPHWGWRDAPLNELFTEIHVVSSIALLLLLAAHVLGVLSHVLAGESAMLKRMWPW